MSKHHVNLLRHLGLVLLLLGYFHTIKSLLIYKDSTCICYFKSNSMGQKEIFCRNQGTAPEDHVYVNGMERISSDNFKCESISLFLSKLGIQAIEGELGKSLDVSNNIKWVKLDGNALTSLTQPHFNSLPNIQKLELQDNSILEITHDLFKGLKMLRYLDLENNKLSKITGQTFGIMENVGLHGVILGKTPCNLQYVYYLYLGSNNINSIEQRSFECFSSLRILQLKKNNIRILSNYVFKGLTSLKTLKLFSNRIETIEDNAFSDCCSELTYLSLVDNQLSALPIKMFQHLPNITELYLGRNKFIHISSYMLVHLYSSRGSKLSLDMKRNHLIQIRSDDLRTKMAVDSINLYDNNIQKIEEFSFLSLFQTTNLNLQKNEIQSIGRNTFAGLIQLNYLVLTNNRIESIEDNSFVHLPKLDTLSLEGNRLWRLTKHIFAGLNSTFSLSLGVNNIEDLEEDVFEPLYSLKYLYLEKNRLTIVKKHYFNGLTQLKKLDLSDNAIHTVDPLAFKDLQGLLFLDLGGNKLKTICTNIFFGLKSLHSLILDNNDLEFVNPEAFSGMYSLNMLNLRKNKLTEFAAGYFNENPVFSRLEYLDLTKNPLTLNQCSLCGLDGLLTLLLDTADGKNSTPFKKIVGLVRHSELKVTINDKIVVINNMDIQPCSPNFKHLCRSQAAMEIHQSKTQACSVKFETEKDRDQGVYTAPHYNSLQQVLIYVSVPVVAMFILVTVVVVSFYVIFRKKTLQHRRHHRMMAANDSRIYNDPDANFLELTTERSSTNSEIPKFNNNVYGNLL